MLRNHPRLRAAIAIAAAILAMPIIIVLLIGRLSQERR